MDTQYTDVRSSAPASRPAANESERALPRGARKDVPVEIAAGIVRGRFSAPVLWNLFWGSKSFYQLLRDMGGISRRALANELEDLEKAGLVRSVTTSRGASRVRYELTPLGESFRLVLAAMYEWGLWAMKRPEDELAVQEPPGSSQVEH